MTRAILAHRPIPLLADPNMRWVAVYEHFVPGERIGYGATKAEAEADLRALTPCIRELEERA